MKELLPQEVFDFITAASTFEPRTEPVTADHEHSPGSACDAAPPGRLSPALEDALARRRSTRAFSPMNEEALLTLLYHVLRVRHSWLDSQGRLAMSSAVPSAGGLATVKVLVAAAEGDIFAAAHPELFRSVLEYDPWAPGLKLASETSSAYEGVLDRMADYFQQRPPVVLILHARLANLLDKYPGGLSLAYEDAGAIIGVMTLVAGAMGLAACPVAAPIVTGHRVALTAGGSTCVGGIALGGSPYAGSTPAPHG